MLVIDPIRNGTLVNTECVSSGLLATEMVYQLVKNGFHNPASYANTHRVVYEQSHLQGYERAHNNLSMELKDRLKLARKHAGFSQVKAAEAARIDQATISNLERGKHHSSTHLLRIADALGVSYRWLTEGKGEMLESSALNEPAGSYDSNVSIVSQPSRYARYPVVSEVPAGIFSECIVPYTPGAEDRYEATDYIAKGTAFWLEVKGDSMTAPPGVKPSIPEGSMVLIDTGIEAVPGNLVVAQIDENNEATFKKLIADGGQQYLKPLNPAYPLMQCHGKCRVLGVAVEAKTKLY